MKAIFFIISTFLINCSLYAGCGTVDLTNPDYLRSVGKDALIEHFKKPRDQDSVGWCAAYSASDAISFATGEPASALDMTISFHANNASGSNNLNSDQLRSEGMVVTDIIKNVQKNGYCPERSIPSNQTFSSNLGQVTLFSFLEYFQDYINKTNGGRQNIENCESCTTKFFEKYIKSSIPGSTIGLVNEVIRKNNGNGLASLKELLTRVCGENRVATSNIKLESVYSVSSQQYVNKIQEALESSSMPSIVINTSTFAKIEAVPGGHSLHAMVVAGKRMGANGKCEYMVRNSWGRSCSFYIPEVAKTCNENAGTFWLSEDQLTKTLNEVTVVKSTGPIKKTNNGGSKIVLNSDNGKGKTDYGQPIINKENKIKPDETNEGKQLSPIPNPEPNPILNQNANNTFSNFFSDLGSMFQNIANGIGSFLSNFWEEMRKSFSY